MVGIITKEVFMARDVVDIADKDAAERSDIRGVAGVNVILGLWLIIAPWVLNYVTGAQNWNSVLTGIGVALFSAIRYTLPNQIWASWLNGILGLWLIISPFVLNTVKTAVYWNEVIVGILVAILAFSNLQYYGRHHYGSPV
jgi:hypothetical protein